MGHHQRRISDDPECAAGLLGSGAWPWRERRADADGQAVDAGGDPATYYARTARGDAAFRAYYGIGDGVGLWPNAIGFATGLFVGSVSLFAYKAARTIVALRWPTFAEHMSQDTREFPAPRAKR